MQVMEKPDHEPGSEGNGQKVGQRLGFLDPVQAPEGGQQEKTGDKEKAASGAGQESSADPVPGALV